MTIEVIIVERINNVDVEVINGEMDNKEIIAYIDYLNDKFPNEQLTQLTLTIDGDYVDMHYHLNPLQFERIRRITGYLVGTLDRFNDAKRAEENDRVKYQI